MFATGIDCLWNPEMNVAFAVLRCSYNGKSQSPRTNRTKYNMFQGFLLVGQVSNDFWRIESAIQNRFKLRGLVYPAGQLRPKKSSPIALRKHTHVYMYIGI